jgi:hypothetical protein
MKKIAFLVSICMVPLQLFSQNNKNDHFDFGISFGSVFPGKIQAADYIDFKPNETYNFTNKRSLLIKGMADYYFLPFLSGGICVNYVPIQLHDDYNIGLENITINMGEFDATIKGRFWATEKLAFKPGISIGYRQTFSSFPDAREKGFCLNAGIETQFYFWKKIFLLCDIGFFTQPYGGVQDVVYVRAGPVFYANIGVGMNFK